MTPRRANGGIFIVSLGLAAGLHGAALAYALNWHSSSAVETKIEDVVTVEIVDAAMLEDETTPEPPTESLPSAAVKASGDASEEAATDRESSATGQAEVVAESAAPERGERQHEIAVEAKPEAPKPVATEAPAPVPTVRHAVEQPVTEPLAAPMPNPSHDVEAEAPPAAMSPLAMAAPHDVAPSVVVATPLPASEARPDALTENLLSENLRQTLRPLKIAALAAKPIDDDVLEALKPNEQIAPKRVAEPETKATKKAEKAAKAQPAKAKRLAALSVENEGGGADLTKSPKTKLKGKSGAKTGKGVSGATTSGQAGIGTYGNTVRTRVARNKPSGMSGRGKAIVTVGISPSGSIRFSRLSKSSGNSVLDRAALSAVQRAAPFPMPPAGATAAQLVFNVQIEYR